MDCRTIEIEEEVINDSSILTELGGLQIQLSDIRHSTPKSKCLGKSHEDMRLSLTPIIGDEEETALPNSERLDHEFFFNLIQIIVMVSQMRHWKIHNFPCNIFHFTINKTNFDAF